MGTKERREREREEVRIKILDAAREMFATHGYEGVSMRKIADKIEYSPTLIYQYFKDKNALIKDLCFTDFRKLAEMLKDLLKLPHPVERLRKCGEEYVRFAMAYPNHYRLMFMSPYPVEHDEEERAAVKGNPETDAYALVRRLVQMASDEGAMRDPHGDQELITQTLWAALHGVVSLELAVLCDKDQWLSWRPLSERTNLMLDVLCNQFFREV